MKSPITLEDPRLTAYALGELRSQEDCAAIEASMETSSELRTFVDDVRMLEHTLVEEFAEETLPQSTPETDKVVAVSSFRWWYVAAPLAAAASIALSFGWLPGLAPQEEREAFTMMDSAPDGLEEGSSVVSTLSSPLVRDAPDVLPIITSGPRVEQLIAEAGDASARGLSDQLATTASISGYGEGMTLGGGQTNRGVNTANDGTYAYFAAPDPASAPNHGLELTHYRSKERFGREMKRRVPDPVSGESYAGTKDNPFKVIEKPGDERATFSTDVDTASYSNVRRFLTRGERPPRDAVRVEEMINYFHYDYPSPANDEKPFSVDLEVNEAPWKAGHRLLCIGLKAKDVMVDDRPDSNLVFLIDVSGSMSPFNKLPLLKKSLKAMAGGLTERDRVSMVVYSGESRVHLEPTPGHETSQLIAAIDRLQSGGSTNGESGIQLAYEMAKRNRIANGVNRVLLATDGDFNVGTTNTSQLVIMAKERAKKDQIFLTVLGFGEGNVQDDRMEQLADQVDGSYHYIDSEREGRKVLIDEMSATLVPMAKDVKIQVEFNPAKVKSYRLIGYANRLLANRDFTDDTKDAGEMGAGHTVTAFYEITPTGHQGIGPNEAPLKYRQQTEAKKPTPDRGVEALKASEDLVTVRLRYKKPSEEESQGFETSIIDEGARWTDASEDFRFAAAVAAFGMRLRDSPYCDTPLDKIRQWAASARAQDEYGWRQEFVDLVRAADQSGHVPRNW